MAKNYRFDTLALHAGQHSDPTTGACAVPIYMTASYEFKSPEHAANLFALREFGNIYTRIMNPTTDVFEQRIAALEGGVGALATASGQSAITLALLNIVTTGQNFVASPSLYGGTHTLFTSSLKKMGVTAKLAAANTAEEFLKQVDNNTRAFYTETIGNPRLDVADLQALAEAAHSVGVPLIVDNTFATPALCRPFEHGADIIIHSGTKFIGGHGTAIGGVIVDSGKFDWTQGKFPEFTTPDATYNGIKYVEAVGPLAYIIKARVQLLRDVGMCLSPMNAWLYIQGLETLHLRMARHSENALKVALFLNEHPDVKWVVYPGLLSHPTYRETQKYLPKGQSSLITFGIRGGQEAGRGLIEHLELFTHVANMGDARSLVIHPSSTTHAQLSPEQQVAAGVTPDLVRVSIGLEDAEDIIEDLDQALKKAAR